MTTPQKAFQQVITVWRTRGKGVFSSNEACLSHLRRYAERLCNAFKTDIQGNPNRGVTAKAKCSSCNDDECSTVGYELIKWGEPQIGGICPQQVNAQLTIADYTYPSIEEPKGNLGEETQGPLSDDVPFASSCLPQNAQLTVHPRGRSPPKVVSTPEMFQ